MHVQKKFCVASFFIFNNYKNKIVFWCFFPFFLVLKPVVSAKISIFLGLKSESNLHFPIQFLEGVDAGCLTLRPYFYPTSLTFGDGQIR